MTWDERSDQLLAAWAKYFLLPWLAAAGAYWLCARILSQQLAFVVASCVGILVLVAIRRHERGKKTATAIQSSEEAAQAALRFLQQDDERRFVLTGVDERPWGWRVDTVPEAVARTGDQRHQIPGHGPIAVMRDGSIHCYPSHMPPERFERQLGAMKSRCSSSTVRDSH